MSTPIQYEDILPGDTIRVEWDYDDMQLTRTGTVTRKGSIDWVTEQGNAITVSGRAQTIYLIDRPKPPLPTEPGTIILAETSLETVQLILRDGMWWYLNGESWYHHNAISHRPWRLLKLVDA